MTTTEMIELLKDYEFGGVTGRAREISFCANHLDISNPEISVESAGDGLITDICFRLEFKPKTNADKIRSMTDEELARFLHTVSDWKIYTDYDGNIPFDFSSIEPDERANEYCISKINQWLYSEMESEKGKNITEKEKALELIKRLREASYNHADYGKEDWDG